MNSAMQLRHATLKCLGTLVAIYLVAACASSTGAKQQSALVNAAQNIERRAAQAYAAGNADSAAATYESAALVYESLALAEPTARARLSAARVLADAGKSEQALGVVSAILAQPQGISPSTQILAHGRAVALYLSLGSAPTAASPSTNPSTSSAGATSTVAARDATHLSRAATHWQSAHALCAQACPEQAALLVLRARLELAQGNAAAAVQSATAALAVAQATTTDTPEQANALRLRAQGYSALGQHARTVQDATAALALDQDAGSAARVQADLQLLAAAHQALGNAEQAARFTQLAGRAQAASLVLQKGAP